MRFLSFSAAAILALTAFSVDAQAQGPGGMMARMQSRAMIMLRGGEDLQKELKITEDQMGKFTELAEEARGLMGGGRGGGGGGGGPDLSALNDIEKDMLKILDDNQRKRLTGIYVQVAGFASLQDDEVANAIGLSDADREKIDEKIDDISRDMQEEMQALMQSGDREGMRQAMTEMREKANQKVMALLSEDQAKKLEDLKGKKFDMPQGFGGRGGAGGRGGEGGRGGQGGGRGGRGGDGGGRGGDGGRGGEGF